MALPQPSQYNEFITAARIQRRERPVLLPLQQQQQPPPCQPARCLASVRPSTLHISESRRRRYNSCCLRRRRDQNCRQLDDIGEILTTSTGRRTRPSTLMNAGDEPVTVPRCCDYVGYIPDNWIVTERKRISRRRRRSRRMHEWNDYVTGMSANCSAQPVVRQRRH